MPRPIPGNRPLASRWIVGVAAVGWFTAIACVAWLELAERQQRRFAATLARHALSAGAAEPSLKQLESLGLVGIEPLVSLAAEQREQVAAAAQQRISRLLVEWERAATASGDVEQFAEQSVALASALETHAHRFGADGQRWAHRLAERLALHGDQFPARRAWMVLASCDHILSRPIASRRAVEPVASALDSPPPPVASSRPSTSQTELPPAPSPNSSPATSQPRPVATSNGAPARAELTVVAPPAGAATSAAILPTTNTLRPPLRLPEQTEAVQAAPNLGPVIDVPSPQDVRIQARANRKRWRRSPASGGGGRTVAAPSEPFRDDGDSANAVARLARELEALPSVERLAALERAAELPPADARSLLRRFVADEDPQVRIKALAILATTSDPKLDELARERAVEDADPRVAAFASELLRSR